MSRTKWGEAGERRLDGTSAEQARTHQMAPIWWERKEEQGFWRFTPHLMHSTLVQVTQRGFDLKAARQMVACVWSLCSSSDQRDSQWSCTGSPESSNTAVWFTLCSQFSYQQNTEVFMADRRCCVQKQQQQQKLLVRRGYLAAVGRGFSFNCIYTVITFWSNPTWSA